MEGNQLDLHTCCFSSSSLSFFWSESSLETKKDSGFNHQTSLSAEEKKSKTYKYLNVQRYLNRLDSPLPLDFPADEAIQYRLEQVDHQLDLVHLLGSCQAGYFVFIAHHQPLIAHVWLLLARGEEMGVSHLDKSNCQVICCTVLQNTSHCSLVKTGKTSTLNLNEESVNL